MQTVTIQIESDLEDSKVTHHDTFISQYENCFTEGQLDSFIDYFERGKELGMTARRHIYDTENTLSKNDESHAFENLNHNRMSDIITLEEDIAWRAQYGDFLDYCHNVLLPQYTNHWFYELREHTRIFEGKVQKTAVGEGYHDFHCETMTKISRDRVLAWSLYLNDVEEGGETEFLYQAQRFKPKRGDFLVWPAGFTHAHRGNPPLSNDKYICTGWVEWV
tara:strand:- start:435 stop:1094 length:660 start_codon:yes stop_codon:yes gene_type:complete